MVLLVCGRSPLHLARLAALPDVKVIHAEDAASTQEPDVLVVLPDAPSPFAVLQRVLAAGGHAEAVLVAAPDRVERARTRLAFTPFVGTHTVLVSADDLPGFVHAVNEAVDRARAHLRYTADLQALRDRLHQPAPSRTLLSASLEVQRHLVATLLSETPFAVIVIDPDDRIVLWNPSAEHLYGITVEEALGKPIDAIFRGSGGTLDAIQRHLRGSARSPLTLEVQHVLADGELGDVEVRIVPLHGPGGAYLGGGLLIRDIRADKAREAARTSFVAALGHDLRTPLQSIRMGLHLLEKRVDPPANTVVERMDSSAQRMHRMIDDLLDLARSGQPGGFPVRPAPFDFDALVRRGVDELASAHPDRQIILQLGGIGTLDIDADRIAQVLANLVGNALTHGDPQGPVTVRTMAADDQVILSVHNTGAPIPPERLETLFEPYVRSSGKSAGLGLGLHISREITRAHGGTIRVTSNAAHGTTFQVFLPRTPR